NMVEDAMRERQREVESGERVIIGVNKLVIPPEEEFEIPIKEVKAEDSERIATRLEEWKKSRNINLINESLFELYKDAKKEDRYNLMPSIIEAVKNYA